MQPKGREQLSLSRLIEVTVDDFDHGLKGWKFFFLALHSRVEPEHLVKLLTRSRGSRVLDERRRLSVDDERKKAYLENLVEASNDYSAWVCEREFQPLLRNLLVGQCVGFENFLKTVGVASLLSEAASDRLAKLIFVPSDEFREAHKTINRKWDELKRGEARTRRFVESIFIDNAFLQASYGGLGRIDLERWSPIWDEGFKLRNAIVHSRARPRARIVIGNEVFSQFDEAAITEHTLRSVDAAFRVVLDSFRISLDDV